VCSSDRRRNNGGHRAKNRNRVFVKRNGVELQEEGFVRPDAALKHVEQTFRVKLNQYR
jgi:hypothetical protein